jgi:dTDP-4-amino-4,6-dideoxygalactose transaminase
MIPRLKPMLGWREIIAALRFPRRNDVSRYEHSFATQMGLRYGIAFPYGRTALLILLEALGLRNKEIICPAYTCVVVPHAILLSGSIPVFVDCQKDDFNMDLAHAEAMVSERTGAIISTSLFGHPVNLDQLDGFRRKHPQVTVIQDCAHAFSARWKERPVQKEGTAALFSTNISKLMTSIFGGMIATNDPWLAEKVEALRDERLRPATLLKGARRFMYLMAVYLAFRPSCYGITFLLQQRGMLDKWVKYYDETKVDMPHDYLERMTAIEARVGLAQLSRYDEIIRTRQEMAALWREHLSATQGIRLPPATAGATWSHFPCLVENRTTWKRMWHRNNLELGQVGDYCIPDMPAYQQYRRGRYPRASYYASHELDFPLVAGVKKKLLSIPTIETHAC